MKAERERENVRKMFVFVGENRSNKAREGNHTWQSCQKNGKPVLCAIQLWDALSNVGLDPDKQIFFNLWRDDGSPDPKAPKRLQKMIVNGLEIIGMGKTVQNELDRLKIPHRGIPHPAARGILRRREVYRARIKKVLAKG